MRRLKLYKHVSVFIDKVYKKNYFLILLTVALKYQKFKEFVFDIL